MPAAVDRKRALVETDHPHLSIRRQCELRDLNRSSYYLPPATESEEHLRLMRRIDEPFLKTPFSGIRRMAVALGPPGKPVNRKRVQGLMRLMGIEAVHPKPRTTTPAAAGSQAGRSLMTSPPNCESGLNRPAWK